MWLWLILENIRIENDDDKRVAIIITTTVLKFQDRILDIIIISLNVLMEGGADKFRAEKINHQNVMLGIICHNPLNKDMVRVWKFKYIIFTKKNRAEEHNPWATIIVIAPFNPIEFKVINLAKIKPIWAIEE